MDTCEGREIIMKSNNLSARVNFRSLGVVRVWNINVRVQSTGELEPVTGGTVLPITYYLPSIIYTPHLGVDRTGKIKCSEVAPTEQIAMATAILSRKISNDLTSVIEAGRSCVGRLRYVDSGVNASTQKKSVSSSRGGISSDNFTCFIDINDFSPG